MMNYSNRNWPSWDLDETTEAELSRFLQKNAEKSERETSQDFKWLLSLMPPIIQHNEGSECEWESDSDDNDEKFPEIIPPVFVYPRNRPCAESVKSVAAPKLQVPMNDDSQCESVDLAEGKKEDGYLSTFGKHMSFTQQNVKIKALLRTFNDEKCGKEEKLKELSILENAENAVLITLIKEASQTIKCDDKKSGFCLLFSEIMRDRTFLLGQYFFLPWFQNLEGLDKKARIPTFTLSQLLNLFPEKACEDVLLPLLNLPQTCFSQDPHLLEDTFALTDPKCWLLLLRKFLVLLNREKLAEWHLPSLEYLCQQTDEQCNFSFAENAIDELINLLLANAVDFSKDRNFGNIILLLINSVKKHRAILNFTSVTSQLSSIIQFYKGPLKYKANQLLKKITT